MTSKRLIALAVTCLALLVIGLLLHRWYSRTSPSQAHQVAHKGDDTTQPTKTANNTEVSITKSDSERPVAPMLELPDLIRDYEQELIEDAERQAGRPAQVAEWTKLRQSGRTLWGSDKWMKDSKYYASLDTASLTSECFSRAVFANEMMTYDDPWYGLQILRVFHNGFSELLRRDDMWKGILGLYDNLSVKIDPKATLAQIVATSLTLDGLEKLYRFSPLKEQTKGKEKLFLAAQLKVLTRYKNFLDHPDPKALGTTESPVVFGEACSVARVAMLLAKQVDEQEYAKIAPVITGVRWTKEQRAEDLRSFIGLVLDSLGPISSKGGDMAH